MIQLKHRPAIYGQNMHNVHYPEASLDSQPSQNLCNIFKPHAGALWEPLILYFELKLGLQR